MTLSGASPIDDKRRQAAELQRQIDARPACQVGTDRRAALGSDLAGDLAAEGAGSASDKDDPAFQSPCHGWTEPLLIACCQAIPS